MFLYYADGVYLIHCKKQSRSILTRLCYKEFVRNYRTASNSGKGNQNNNFL